MRPLLVISSLSSGGAERVASRMANYWAGKGWCVWVVTLASTSPDFYKLDPGVSRVALDVTGEASSFTETTRNILTRVKALRASFRSMKPQAIISFVDRTNILTILGALGLRIPVIVCERTDPRHHSIGRVWTGLRRLLYPLAGAVVVQSESVKEWARAFLLQRKLFVIPNHVVVDGEYAEEPISWSCPFVVAVGRLEYCKGFDSLIRAFGKAVQGTDWSLVILGEGPEGPRLRAMAGALGVEKHLHFAGTRRDVLAVMKRAGLFVLSSRYEGFPNALLEAMSCGLPVISFDCPSGPREIIRHGVDGILVPPGDVDAMAKAMARMMADEGERQRLGIRAQEVVQRFSAERVMGMWEELLQRVSHGDGA